MRVEKVMILFFLLVVFGGLAGYFFLPFLGKFINIDLSVLMFWFVPGGG